MEAPVKEGPLLVLLQEQQPAPGIRLLGNKRWKKGWFALFLGSGRGVARLEFWEEGKKKSGRSVVRLSDCLSLAPESSGPRRPGLAAFRLETPRRTLLLAAEPHEAHDWMARLAQAAFPQQAPGVGQAAEQAEGQPQEMAANAIYFSQEEGSEFWVTVQKTEAAERCGLRGRYRLRASREGLLLVDPLSGQTLYSWPYRLLRRYGRDKVMFSFEAGRRCESGPGNFTFETPQGSDIFRLVEVAIRAQKAQVEEDRRSGLSMDADVGQLHSALATSLSLEAEGPGPERHQWQEGVPQGAALSPPAMGRGEGAGPTLKGQATRDSAAPFSGPPPPSSPEAEADAAASVYSEPLDVVRGSPARPDPLYADPVDSRGKEGLRPQSRLYERVGPGAGDGGHIYDEPEGRAPQPIPPTAPAIYDEARLPSEAWRTQGLETPAGYEVPYLPDAGDYAVPPFHPKAGLPRAPKPCPVPKPHRSHKGSLQTGGTGKPKMAARNGSNHNNSNNTSGDQPGGVGVSAGEPIYSQVRKPPRGRGSPREEQSVDGSRPASAVYEDLGEI